MRYDELQLERLTPDGLPLNDSAQLVSRGAINKFFLTAFNAFYNSIRHEVRATQAPYSLAACLACDDDELNGFLQEVGAAVFYPLDHDIKARFVNALAVSPLCSDDIIDALTKYAFERATVTGRAVYDGCAPYHFKILLSGDFTGADISRVIGERVNANANLFNTCTEVLDGFTAEQVERNAEAVHVGGDAVSAAQSFKIDQSFTAFYNLGDSIPMYKEMFSWRRLTIPNRIFFASDLKRAPDLDRNSLFAYVMTPNASSYLGGVTVKERLFFTNSDNLKRVFVRESSESVPVRLFGCMFRQTNTTGGGYNGVGKSVFLFPREVAAGCCVLIDGGTGRTTYAGITSTTSTNLSKYKFAYRVEDVCKIDNTISYSVRFLIDGLIFVGVQDSGNANLKSLKPYGLKIFIEQ